MHSLVCKNIYFLQKINEEAVVSKNLYYPVSPAATQNCMFSNNPCTCTQTTHSPYIRAMGLRTPRESLFSKTSNFWAWADILAWNVLRHLGYFWPDYQHPFLYCKSLVHGFHLPYSTIISTKNYAFTSKSQKKYLGVGVELGWKELEI